MIFPFDLYDHTKERRQFQNDDGEENAFQTLDRLIENEE